MSESSGKWDGLCIPDSAVCPTCWVKDMSKQMWDQTISMNLTGTFLAVLDKSEQLMYNYIKLWNGVSWRWPEQTLGIDFLSDSIVKIGRYFCITIATAALILPIIVLLVRPQDAD